VLEKANMILTVSYLMSTRNSFFMCHILPEVMHESWVENREQVICHFLFKNITKLDFFESQLLSTSLEFEIGRKNLFRKVHAYIIQPKMENFIFDFVSFSIIANHC
jgi:hypothetical protein